MKNIVFYAIAICCWLYSCTASKKQPARPDGIHVIKDSRGNPMLLGKHPVSSLLHEPYSKWFNENKNAYQPADSFIQLLKPALKGKQIEIFLGTWCGDSRREVPRMMKVLSACGFDNKQLNLVFVSNHDTAYKQSPQHEERGKLVHRVPTFIVYENNREVGRIVESPLKSLEEDLTRICLGPDYQSKYRAVPLLHEIFRKLPVDSIQSRIQETAVLLKPLVANAGELNGYGYVLMASEQKAEALTCFLLNAALYPQTANVYDSLGEFYLLQGDKAKARENYQMVLKLEPGNKSAAAALEKL